MTMVLPDWDKLIFSLIFMAYRALMGALKKAYPMSLAFPQGLLLDEYTFDFLILCLDDIFIFLA